MQNYNTSLSTIKLPEYGRYIQKLVEYCLTIPDRETRTRQARQIVKIMGNLYPAINQVENYQSVLWDHLAMISDFKLDIDYPYPIIQKTHLNNKPDVIDYKLQRVKYRMYGKVTEDLIQKACELTDPAQRIRLFELCANHMKLNFHQINVDADEDDDKIIQDLLEYTGGRFKDEIYQVFLYSAQELAVNTQYNAAALTPSKKKKKKKK